jgi:hypothetical protein
VEIKIIGVTLRPEEEEEEEDKFDKESKQNGEDNSSWLLNFGKGNDSPKFIYSLSV